MKKFGFLFLVVLFLFLTLIAPDISSADNGNLLENGGFEKPIVTDMVNKWTPVYDGTPNLGWTIMWHNVPETFGSWIRPQTPILEIQKRGHIGTPKGGEQYAELDSDWNIAGAWAPSNIKIYQLVDVSNLTCPKGTREAFQLNYSWAPRPGNPDNHMQVFWNGKIIAEHQASGVGDSDIVWRDEIFRNLDRNRMDKFRVTFWEIGPGDSKGTFLDNVGVYRKCK